MTLSVVHACMQILTSALKEMQHVLNFATTHLVVTIVVVQNQAIDCGVIMPLVKVSCKMLICLQLNNVEKSAYIKIHTHAYPQNAESSAWHA